MAMTFLPMYPSFILHVCNASASVAGITSVTTPRFAACTCLDAVYSLVQGRAYLEARIKLKEKRYNNVGGGVMKIVVDGYNAPVTAGAFVDLVDKKFYDNMEIQRADGLVVQTGRPEGNVILTTNFSLSPPPPSQNPRLFPHPPP